MKKLYSDDNYYLGIVRYITTDEIKTLRDFGYDFYIFLDKKVYHMIALGEHLIDIQKDKDFAYIHEEEMNYLIKVAKRDEKFKVAIDGADYSVHFLLDH